LKQKNTGYESTNMRMHHAMILITLNMLDTSQFHEISAKKCRRREPHKKC